MTHGFFKSSNCDRCRYNARKLTILEPIIEAFQAGQLLEDDFRDRSAPAWAHHVHRVGEKPRHPLLLKAAREPPYRIRMQVGFLGTLGDGAIGKEHQGADDLITPLDMIWKVQGN